MRTTSIFFSLCLASTAVLAQDTGENSPPTQRQPNDTPSQAQPADKHNQRIERIQLEDGGSRVDELRVGGETKTITVQPKVGNLPAYEVQPQKAENADGTNGRRVWRALQF